MREIILICSVHEDVGLCNVAQLVEILKGIEPEVVFEERNPDKLYPTPGSLEVRALSAYGEVHLFRRIPVDHYNVSDLNIQKLLVEMNRAKAYLEYASPDYRELEKIEGDNTSQYGFEYLNSDLFGRLRAKLREVEDNVLSQASNPQLFRGLDNWRNFGQRREVEMVRNIYEYARKNDFSRAAFLIGANHKHGVLKEIQKLIAMEPALIQWVIFPHDGFNSKS